MSIPFLPPLMPYRTALRQGARLASGAAVATIALTAAPPARRGGMADDVSAVSATAPGAAGLLPMADAMASSTACSDTAGLATVRVPGRLFGRADRRMAPDGAAVGPGSMAAGRGAARLAAALARGAGRARRVFLKK